jgi:hypothetical protein
VDGATRFAYKFIDCPDLTVILEPSAYDMEPALAAITANPSHITKVLIVERYPDEVAGGTASLVRLFGFCVILLFQ